MEAKRIINNFTHTNLTIDGEYQFNVNKVIKVPSEPYFVLFGHKNGAPTSFTISKDFLWRNFCSCAGKASASENSFGKEVYITLY